MYTKGKHTNRYRCFDSCTVKHHLSLGISICRQCTLPWVQNRMVKNVNAKHRGEKS